ncbi:killer cell lectin-like receptor 2 [Hippopotamus amphibius kiboko]|uniref:killer cell lectin-like receptor 2 n=1 Tax=Hippopotamus amphibius kiboko TaxID=575201 RepID=UPI002598AB04|nr:killer cell lectin-like receptor 2 [Hippopotamus amphibius kiboko]
MSDQDVTYTPLRFLPSPLESQNRLRPGDTQRPGKTDGKESSVPWRGIAVTLGILCLLLLMTTAVLGTKIFQYIQERQQKEILRNLSQKYHIKQNDSLEQLGINKPSEYDNLETKILQPEKGLDLLSTKRKGCHREENFSKFLWNTGELNEGRCCCWGVICYFFTTEKKDWKGCEQTCENYNSFLLMIDDKDELCFLQSQTYQSTYWIGLSFNEKESKWKWIDNGLSSGLNLTIMTSSGRGKCAFLSSTRVTSIDCSNEHNCICEKRIDFFSRAKNKRT